MSPENIEFSEYNFTGAEVVEALGSLPEDIAQGVISKLREAQVNNKEKAKVNEVHYLVAELAVAAHQNVVPTEEIPNMLDPVTWSRYANDTSYYLLRGLASLEEQHRNMVPQSAMDWATYRYVSHGIMVAEEEGDMDKVLQPLGLSVQTVYERWLELASKHKVLSNVSEQEIRDRLPGPDDFTWLFISDSSEFDRALEGAMRKDLEDAGYKLPELKDDNSYGYDEDEGYLAPEINESMYPNPQDEKDALVAHVLGVVDELHKDWDEVGRTTIREPHSMLNPVDGSTHERPSRSL